MRLFWAALLAALAAWGQTPPLYKNADAPLAQRVDDLLSRLTAAEKVSQMMNDSPAIERLGIPAYDWWSECLHGVARAGRATVFPEPIGLAATWDPGLIFRMATAISDEARAKYNEFQRRGKRSMYQGLTFWSPNINLVRDPRWGRGMETYGEDPYLTGRMAIDFIQGLQGNDPKYLKVVATAKHFAVHSGPESSRHSFDAKVEDADLTESYLPHFEAAIRQGGAYSVMCSYNQVDGEPACASPRLLGDILRKEWGFSGYVVSDCGAVGDIFQGHHTVDSMAAAAARAVKAGTDLDCGNEYGALLPALEQKLIAEADIDTAVRRLLTARFRLGMFDPPERVSYSRIPLSEVDSEAHQTLALEAAHKSIVLLKNQGGLLPLKKTIKTLAVIGPNADSVETLLGNYNGDPSAPVTPLAGLRVKLGTRTKILYAQGGELGDGLPAMETVPASALFTTDGADRRGGLLGEYFNTASFNGQVYRAPGKTPAPAEPDAKPLFTRVDAAIDFKWWDGAPRADMDDARFHVVEFRGFEKFCEGRHFTEMPQITPRVCGICPVSHLLASAKACDAIVGREIPRPAKMLRELMHMGQIIQSHALSFFHLSAPDLLLGFDADPAVRNIVGLIQQKPDIAIKGVRLRKFGQELIKLVGGRKIHADFTVPGGVNKVLTTAQRDEILKGRSEQGGHAKFALDLLKEIGRAS